MGRGATRQYALVEWLTGTYKGTLTPNVNTEWIKDFNDTDVGGDESVVVEWRQPPMPKAGWPLFDAKVLVVSTDLTFLERRCKEAKQERGLAVASVSHPRTHSPTNPPDVQALVAAAVREALQAQKPAQAGSPASNTPTRSASEQVRIGKALFVDRATYSKASYTCSHTQACKVLVRKAFSRKRLIRSSYAGQARTINGVKRQSPGLKRYQKMKDISDFLLIKFPHLTQSNISVAVNACTGERNNTMREVEYVDTSGSEEELSAGEELDERD